ncbi:MAG: tRNA-uridine aminocarboxypropyltransferase [Undibacterium umbellatum]|uniref:tRNA-uridine aminocarboxypropyltransferase n=1 Tax=Undibacterium umbellatum TaxID=2762300 RepID=UPI003BB607A1
MPKRKSCPRCLRPSAACICHWICKVNNAPEVLLLQHPLEVNNAKGSARLLDLCLKDSCIVEGEQFDQQLLISLLQAGGKQAVLLYPETTQNGAQDLQYEAPEFVAHDFALANVRLVVIDATWRKSRKMLYLNPSLQQLPRLSLQNMPASHYRIRKAHAPDQLSTLEAACYALMQLEQDEEKYQPLLEAFDGFVGQQMEFKNKKLS